VLRAGGAAGNLLPKKDYAAQALLNKANEKEERDRRRKSVALPASLMAPSIVSLIDMLPNGQSYAQAPRQNRSSALRTGGDMPPTSMRGLASAANMDQAKMGSTDIKPVLTRRASVGVRSLGAPSIVSLLLGTRYHKLMLGSPSESGFYTSKSWIRTCHLSPNLGIDNDR